jgi:murein DD-endopeptidase MepM/ murein hydrolase activator NlpD
VVATAVTAGAVALVSSDAPAYASLGGLPSPTLRAPTAPFSAVRLFDQPASPWGAGHRGVDIEAAIGDPVLAPGDGVVTFAGTVVDRGVVTVDVGAGVLSSVEPVEASVTVGQSVREGERIGTVTAEHGHCGSATCVHWGVRVQGEYVNPLDLLAGYGRIVLLP